MIRVDQLECRTADRRLLEPISFALESGQVVAVVGPNGAGKSTLLRVLGAEAFAPQGLQVRGEVWLDDKLLHRVSLQALARRRSFLMQSHASHLSLSVTMLVELGAYPHGGLRRDQHHLLEAVLSAWELTPLAARSYDTLSGGERQRVQLARTALQMVLHEPAQERVWLLDEPLNGLDLPHQQLLRRQLRTQAEAGALVLFSVHDINFALRTADRVLALNNGRLLYAGPTQGLADPALLRDIFGTGFVCLTHPHDGQPLVIPE